MPFFPLRPLEPSVLEERSFKCVTSAGLSAALDVMILGSIEQGNRIVSILYDHNVLTFENDDLQKVAMHFAWDTSQQWPTFILKRDPNKPAFVRSRSPHFGKSDESLREMEKWSRQQWAEDLRKKYPSFDDQDLQDAFSRYDEQAKGGKKLGSAGIIIEMAFVLSQNSNAEELLKEIIPLIFGSRNQRDYTTNQRQSFAGNKKVWQLLSAGFVKGHLNISDNVILNHVESTLYTLTQRFEKGPERPFRNQSIRELIDLLDVTWLQIKPHEREQSALVNCDDSPIPNSFTHRGLSAQKIRQMEERLGTELPRDFKEFLAVTNGFYTGDPQLDIDIFKPADIMAWQEPGWPETVELLPYDELPSNMMNLFKWPKLPRGLQTGSGTDEGYQLLIEPNLVKSAVEEFDTQYAAADEGTKRVLERVVADLYGSIEELRQMEWMMLVTFHWNPVSIVFG
ncbi:uncharacterized protein KY384_002641 [Bacidia gigantensis]|uniref:uncharacterized protein n=1 Tax=Bacidia gigantensis TaxID=2732470 RepID=UPI001D04C185|nr:uncharacterized protein KY384_002641 [Bacidia gigantensis]KAG8532763.1 hypothetical protein KY384_002641 [Bacidia gigantensis]